MHIIYIHDKYSTYIHVTIDQISAYTYGAKYILIYLLIIHIKHTIEGNAQNILATQHNIKAKALNATHGSKLNC